MSAASAGPTSVSTSSPGASRRLAYSARCSSSGRAPSCTLALGFGGARRCRSIGFLVRVSRSARAGGESRCTSRAAPASSRREASFAARASALALAAAGASRAGRPPAFSARRSPCSIAFAIPLSRSAASLRSGAFVPARVTARRRASPDARATPPSRLGTCSRRITAAAVSTSLASRSRTVRERRRSRALARRSAARRASTAGSPPAIETGSTRSRAATSGTVRRAPPPAVALATPDNPSHRVEAAVAAATARNEVLRRTMSMDRPFTAGSGRAPGASGAVGPSWRGRPSLLCRWR